MKDLSGKIIRGYELRERIGEGGFGVVYRAHQPSIERDVVIKAILPVYANNPDFIRNFEAEAQLIARLEHLHIVPLYDYWRGPDGAFLVMRWLRGGSLLDSIDSGPWKAHAVSRLLDQIAGALTTAHRNHVVHQDIKPANILLDDDNNAYLTDFGLAKDLETQLDLSVASDANVHGSPAYVSPEQVKREQITARTDIYSLGIVLYELLCGEHPFATNEVVRLLQHQLNTQLPSLQNKQPELPDGLNLVLWRATAKDPEIRFGSVIEMAEDFRRAIADFDDSRTMAEKATSSRPATIRSDTGLISLDAIEALLTTPPNPYKGLRAFQEADAADFFGRDALVETLLQRLGETGDAHRFLAVVGPSGSGKSSVVKAGLVPAIRRGRISDWDRWFIVDMTPGTEPLAELTNSLHSIAINTEADLASMLANNVHGLHHSTQALLPDDGSEVILIIDQFEEIFTLVNDATRIQHFLDLITHTVTAPDSRVRLILTLRADFYDRPLYYAGLGDLMRKRTELILPLSEPELRQVILAPAESAGLKVENQLTEVILSDIAHQQNALPLLQYTLTELYEQRKKDTLTFEAYRQLGGIAGALAQRADELYAGFDETQRLATHQIFLRLVVPGEGTEDTRRRVLQTELMSLTNDRATIQHILDTFGRYRLLTFDHDPETRAPTVEIAHEALIRRWAKMREWLNESRDHLRIQHQLTSATEEWQQVNRDASYLPSGARLTQFEEIARLKTIALNQNETDYLQAGVARRNRNVRLRQTAIMFLLFITFAMLALAVIAFDQRNRSEEERQRADQEALVSRSRELAASALVTGNQIDLPLLLSVEALANADTLEARNSLLTTLQNSPHLNTFLNGHSDAIRSVTFGQQYIASGSRDQTVRLWDANTHEPVEPPLTGHNSWINAVILSPDETRLASGSADGTIIIWDIGEQNTESMRLTGHTDAVWSLAFSPDGKLLASGSADNTIRLWDVDTGQEVAPTLNQHEGIVYALVFSSDGKQLASGSADSTVRLWNTETFQLQHTLEGHSNWVFSIDFSPDGTVLASGSADNTIRFWNPSTGASLGNPLRGHADWVRSVTFDRNGQRLFSGSADGFILVWDVATGQPIDLLENSGREAIWTLSFSDASEQLVSGGINPALLLWNLDSQSAFSHVVGQQTEEILTVTVSPDNKYLASAGGQDHDFAVKLWDGKGKQQLATLSGHTAPVTSATFHPTLPRLATGSVDRTVMIWDLETNKLAGRIETEDSIFAIDYSPDGERLAIGHNNGHIEFWRVAGTSDHWRLDEMALAGHQDRVSTIAFHPDGRRIASASRDASIRLWDTSAGEVMSIMEAAHDDGILSIAFSPDGSLLASGGRDATVRLWNITETGLQPGGDPLEAHTNWVMDVAFSPDSQMIASASGDRTIILWHIIERRPIGNPLVGHTDWVNELVFAPDGQQLFSGGRDGQLLVWPASVESWQERACHIANRNFTPEEQRQYFRDQTPRTQCKELR